MPPGAGPVWAGGFAFSPEGGRSPLWSSLPPALVVMPELMLVRADGVSFMTLATVVSPDRSLEEATARLRSRVASLREGPLPMLDPNVRRRDADPKRAPAA